MRASSFTKGELPRTRSQASTQAPISQGQTVSLMIAAVTLDSPSYEVDIVPRNAERRSHLLPGKQARPLGQEKAQCVAKLQFAAGPGQVFDMHSAARALHAPRPVNQEYGDGPHRNKAPTPRLEPCVVNWRRFSAAPASRSRALVLDHRLAKLLPARPAIAESLERQHPSQCYVHETGWLKQSGWTAQPVSTFPPAARSAWQKLPPNAAAASGAGFGAGTVPIK